MTARRASDFRWVAVFGLAALAIGLSACGKRGNLEAPKGEEKAYSYPLFYPPPDTVVPAAEPPASEEAVPKDEPFDRPLSPIPSSLDRTRTETYQ